MHPAILPAALALTTASAMAVYVASQRDKSDLHWLLLVVLLSLMTWTTGTICRFSVHSEEALQASLRLLFLGLFATPPSWLLLASRYSRMGGWLQRRELYVALAIPSALAYLALLTNEGHRLVIREVSFTALEAGPRAWAGPAFWIIVGWCYLCALASTTLYLATARRLVANRERRRGLLLGAAALLPIACSLPYTFQLVPVSFDLTPLGLVGTLMLISAAVFRYELLECLPLARRDVIEHLRDGVVMASASGAILDLNPSAERILGSRAVALRHRSLAAVLAELGPSEEAALLRGAIENLDGGPGPVVAELESTDRRRIEVAVAWVRDQGGLAAGQFAVLRDRTEERRLERVLRQAQKHESVGTLASGIAHEVNNPLAFIRANLIQIHRMGEHVEESVDGPERKLARELVDLRSIAEETLDGIGRIERIVADMRRLSAGMDEALVRVDVNEVVRDAIRLANLHRLPDLDLRTRLRDPLPGIDGSPRRLAQALLNLLVNAVQALEGTPQPRLDVETARDGEGVVIRVRDNGPGIPPKILERIFDPFFTTKDPDRGTGLGLAIAFDIVRDHGGVVEAISPPGEGATFLVRLAGSDFPS